MDEWTSFKCPSLGCKSFLSFEFALQINIFCKILEVSKREGSFKIFSQILSLILLLNNWTDPSNLMLYSKLLLKIFLFYIKCWNVEILNMC